jgi:cytochrome c biogenesis protein CcmG, thiol:disulfide interchange protein DsbE
MSARMRSAQMPPATIHMLEMPVSLVRMIARQIRITDFRHRLRTAARVRSPREGRQEKNNRQYPQHRILSLDAARPSVGCRRHAVRKNKSLRAYFVPARAARGRAGFGSGSRLLPVAATACVLLLASACNPAGAAPEIGAAAPALVVTALDGQTFDLAKLRGKVVLVNYWATWCAPCRKEMPKLDAFYRRYRDRGLEIIGISIDFDRDLGKARRMAGGVSYPMALAKSVTDDGFGTPKGVPITWIIDTDGKVRDRMIEVRDELLNGLVVPLLPR